MNQELSRGVRHQGNDLQQSVEQSAELAAVSAASNARAEIESSIIIAKKMPRNDQEAWQRAIKACQRPSLAEAATYSFPRGGKDVSGPSVDLARELARCWGNIRFGLRILRDDDSSRLIQGWAWDLETNMKVEAEDSFEKLIQRKNKHTGQTEWIEPDERDLRELTNRRGAILVRNCILQTVPKDMVEDALLQCEKTLRSNAAADPDATRKRLMADFASINVSVSMIEGILKHPFDQASPKELAELRATYNSIAAGNSTWQEYAKSNESPESPKTDLNDQLSRQHKPQEQATTGAGAQPDGPTSPPSEALAGGGPEHMTLQEWHQALLYLDADKERMRVKNLTKMELGMKPGDKLQSLLPAKQVEFLSILMRIAKREDVEIAF